jgi:hypothetical protein
LDRLVLILKGKDFLYYDLFSFAYWRSEVSIRSNKIYKKQTEVPGMPLRGLDCKVRTSLDLDLVFKSRI